MESKDIEEIRPSDLITIESHRVGEHRRTGKVLEVMGERGHKHLRVRWQDEHETIVYPGQDVSVEHFEHEQEIR